MKPKTLIFSLSYRPLIGGAEVALEEVTKRIDDFEFDLITARFSRRLLAEERINNTNVYRVGFGLKLDKYLFPFLGFLKARSLHQKNSYQVVWAMMANYAGLAALFFKLVFKKVKYLLTLQSGDADSFILKRTWFWLPLYRQIYRKADKIQAISQCLKQRAKNYGYQCEVEVVPNGVDFEKFSQKINDEEKSNLLNHLNIKTGDKVIITVSRLVEKNAVGDLIESLKYLPESYILLIIGGGKLEKDLRFKTKDLRLENRVHFLGKKDHQQVARYLNISDIFCRPSLTEGFGNVFVEAMAAGLPIIGTYVGGLKDFLKNEETGLVCEAKNPQSIAEAVKKLENPELKEKLVQNGLSLAQEKYNWNIISDKICRMLID